ncbi:hypothetical protein STEG23_009308, partial [Scotinomys teguina]
VSIPAKLYTKSLGLLQSVAVGIDYLEHEETEATTPCLFCFHSLPGRLLPSLTNLYTTVTNTLHASAQLLFTVTLNMDISISAVKQETKFQRSVKSWVKTWYIGGIAPSTDDVLKELGESKEVVSREPKISHDDDDDDDDKEKEE